MGISFHAVLALVMSWQSGVAIAHPETSHDHYELSQSTGLTNSVRMTIEGNYRYIYSNGIPDHSHSTFPNSKNPNRISAQNYTFKVPANPAIANQMTSLGLSPFGVAINGVTFDPGAAEFWNNNRNSGWQYEALSGKLDLGLDENNAHVQPTGAYHYHGLPWGLIAKNSGHKLIGYAADGFPIYAQYGYSDPENANSVIAKIKASYRVKAGNRASGPGGNHDGSFVEDYEFVATAGGLDACNGRWGVTPDYPQGTYHYFITDTFPFIPRCFRGTPDSSFQHSMGGGRSPQQNNQRQSPPPHHRHGHPPRPRSF